jgi:hypothetical protein
VTVYLAPGFFTPCLDEKPLRLWHSELCPSLHRTLLLLQTYGPLAGCPEVDDFRHMNYRRYPDASKWIGTDPLIWLNYADTVALDHY